MRSDPDMREFESLDGMANYFRGRVGLMDELKRRGFSLDELFNMSPKRAREIIADSNRNRLTERYGRGAAAPPDTVCRVCGKPGARYFSVPLGPGEQPDRFPMATALHLECCPKGFENG